MAPLHSTLPTRSNLLNLVYVLGLIAFWLAGGIGGLWAGEQLWRWLGVETSFLTVYADMAFLLLGLFAGTLVGGVLVMCVEAFLFDRWLARVKAEIDAGTSPACLWAKDLGETLATGSSAEPGTPSTHALNGPRPYRPRATASKARYGSRAFQRVTQYDHDD
jgi:hypothetical protein